jgi:hypothetical protein
LRIPRARPPHQSNQENDKTRNAHFLTPSSIGLASSSPPKYVKMHLLPL